MRVTLMKGSVESDGLRRRPRDHVVQLGLVEVFRRSKVDATAPGRHCPDPVLRLPRVSDLAHRHGLERQREPPCDLGGHCDPTAGETDDDRIAQVASPERLGQRPSRIETIVEQRGHRTLQCAASSLPAHRASLGSRERYGSPNPETCRRHCYDHTRPDGSSASVHAAMADDPDALFSSRPTTRRGLLSAFSRRAAEALPVPEVLDSPLRG